MLTLAVIGHGSIAQYVARNLQNHPAINIKAVISRPGREEAARSAMGRSVDIIHNAGALAASIDVVVDCAGHAGLKQHGAEILLRGFDLITVSTGALADAGIAVSLENAARTGNSHLQLAAGAVGAIDALAAAKVGGLESVTYKGRKPPKGWAGSPAEQSLDLDGLREAAVHFAGSARDAALQYPKNANVAATVALAGIGLDDTQVELIADPAIDANIHEIEAQGDFGAFTFQIQGTPLPGNPRSSALAAMSAVRCILNRVEPLII